MSDLINQSKMVGLDEQMNAWDKPMKELMGEKWDTLTYYQKMCEIIAVKEAMKNNPISSLFGFGFNQGGYE